jgi:hypothetical protein
MYLTTEWDNPEQTILRVTYHPGWGWVDMEKNAAVERGFLDSVNHKVDMIADFRGTVLPPGAIIRLPQIAASPAYIHVNSGLMIMVGSPVFMDEVVSIYRKVYGKRVDKLHMVPTLEQARQRIADLHAEVDQPDSSEKLA